MEDRLHHLTVQQNKMGSVLGRLRQVESGLSAPDTSASADPHSTITALGQAATMLNEVLRRVDQAHAELPPIFEAGVDPTLPQLENVQLPDVDAETRVRYSLHFHSSPSTIMLQCGPWHGATLCDVQVPVLSLIHI